MKSIYLALVCVIFSTSLIFAQNQQEIESLLQQLERAKNDSIKSTTLINIWNQYINTDNDEAMRYAQKLVDLGKSSKKESIVAAGYMRLAISHSYISIDSSLKYNKLALRSYEISQDTLRTAVIQLNMGINYTDLGAYDKALETINAAFDGFSAVKDTLGMGQTLDNRCRLYFDQGFYRLALVDALDAITYVEKVNNPDWLNLIYERLGSIYSAVGDTVAANKTYNRTIDRMDANVNLRKILQIQLEQAEMYVLYNYNLDVAESTLQNIIPKIEELKDYLPLLKANMAMAYIKIQKKEFQESIIYLDKNMALFQEFNSVKLKAQTLSALSSAHLQLNNLDKAKEYAQNGLALSQEIGTLEEQGQAYDILSQIAKKKSDYPNAMQYVELKNSIKDSLYNIKKVNQIQELNILHEAERKEAEIALQEEEINTLNAQAKVDQLTKGLYAGGMASALALSGLLVFGFRQRMKKNRIAREKQEEIYRQEIAHKKKELASQTLHLVQKNTFIQELMENLESIKNSPEKFKMEFRRIVMLLKKENASDKDWEVFKTYFAEVHNDFDQKLKTLYPDISEKEIRLAAFLRMNLTTKEIAATLNVLPDSILKSKYRLKKKLELDKETDLASFLNTL